MTNSRSWILDVLEVKQRKLEEILSPKRTMLANLSISASVLARFKPPASPATNWNDASATPPHKKPPTTRGGRKRLATEKQSFYMIGYLVDQRFRQLESGFLLLKQLKFIHPTWDLNAYRSELAKHRLAPKEIEALLNARTLRGAAKRLVAQSLSSNEHPNGLSLRTIQSYHSRYLKTLKSKRPLL
jgi:hypothetical protein